MLKLLPNEEAKAENTCHDLSHRHAFIANTQRTDADDEKPERQHIESGSGQIQSVSNSNVR